MYVQEGKEETRKRKNKKTWHGEKGIREKREATGKATEERRKEEMKRRNEGEGK